MITLGAILLLIGAFTDIAILYSVGGILLIIGVVLLIAGKMGHALGGRPHYF